MRHKVVKALLLTLFISSVTFAQSRVKEKDVIGKWKFHLDLTSEIEKEKLDSDDWGDAFARGILKTVDRLVETVDITFHFKKNNVLIVTKRPSIGGQDDDVEVFWWKIDEKGRVVTSEMDKDHLKLQSNSGWMLKRGKLVVVDEDDDVEETVWMERVK